MLLELGFFCTGREINRRRGSDVPLCVCLSVIDPSREHFVHGYGPNRQAASVNIVANYTVQGPLLSDPDLVVWE